MRRDGGVGTRNYIGVLSTVNCLATVAREAEGETDQDLFFDKHIRVF